jgi:predicted KAP-like P-loop ATPase
VDFLGKINCGSDKCKNFSRVSPYKVGDFTTTAYDTPSKVQLWHQPKAVVRTSAAASTTPSLCPRLVRVNLSTTPPQCFVATTEI